MKKISLLFFTILLGILILTGCDENINLDLDSDEEPIEYEEAEGGEITLALRNLKSLNPLLNSSEDVYQFNKLIYEGLFEIRENLEPVPLLVDEYTISEDAKRINIKLKKDVIWHEGENLDSEDVKFTIDTIKYGLTDVELSENMASLYKRGSVYDMEKISKVEIVSEDELNIYFNESTGDILEFLTFPMISKKNFSNYEEALREENYKVLGTGPYKLGFIDIYKEVELVKNEDYWGGKPNIDIIQGLSLEGDNAYTSAFESGRIKAIYDRNSDWENYAENERIEISEFPSNIMQIAIPNSRSEIFKGQEGKQFRKAISLAIDRESILEEVYLGYGYLANTIINPNSWLSSAELKVESLYKVDEAKSILNNLGYKDTNEDGIVENSEGENLTIRIKALALDDRTYELLDYISSDLGEIGIEVQKDYPESVSEYNSSEEEFESIENFKGGLSTEEYDLALIKYEKSYTPSLSNLLHSKNIESTNFGAYSSKEVDKLLDSIDRSSTKEQKKELYIELEELLIEENPIIPIVYERGALISYRKVNGEISPSYFSAYQNIENWFIPDEFQLKE